MVSWLVLFRSLLAWREGGSCSRWGVRGEVDQVCNTICVCELRVGAHNQVHNVVRKV